MASAIPQAERRELQVFVDLHASDGEELELHETVPPIARAIARSPRPAPTWASIGGLSAEHQVPWQELARWERGRMANVSADEWSKLVATVDALVARCLPAPDALLEQRDLVERLGEFAVTHANSDGTGPRTSRLEATTLENLARWSVDAVRAFPVGDVTAHCEPFVRSRVDLPPKAELWMNFAHLADSVLSERELQDSEELNGALFSAIDEVAREAPDRLAWNIFDGVRGWFRGAAPGKAVLWSLLTNRVRHGEVLSLCLDLNYLEAFLRDQQKELIATWLTRELSPPILSPREFAREAGRHLGWAAMVRYDSGEPTGSYDALPGLIAAPSAAGVLSDPALHALFVGQSVFGAKEAVAGGGVPLSRAREFATLMEQCWQVLVPALVSERRASPSFALSVFHPILRAQKNSPPARRLMPEDRLAWWRVLRPLAISVVREGPGREACWIFHCMRESPLLAQLHGTDILELLVALSTAAASRVFEDSTWRQSLWYASSIIESVAANTEDNRTRDQLYALVEAWANPPLAIENAGAVARRLRRL